ncbi:hypothetical protein [Sinimarinibacterium flocculans]|uniref:hypothetical protein n=1 Tax=Sinimarinibacterium flocculans TaxID=985250 RepID=UPI0024938DFD|nr:hypothetical protein [Sinimarinibacterium flocculans]
MTVREDVLAAANPREALLVLADAIDSLQSKPADLWSAWDDELKAAPEQTRAKEGWENLHHEPGQKPIEHDSATGEPTKAGPFSKQTEDGAPVVEFPAPTYDQEGKRIDTIPHLDFENMTSQDENGNEYRLFDREDTEQRREEIGKLAKAYLKAGPVWLYLSNRDHVIQLPIDVRQNMIADVEEVDPKYAYHMAKDILMDRGDQGADKTALPIRSDPTGAIA